MRSRLASLVSVGSAIVLCAPTALAQTTVSGSAEVTVERNTTEANSETNNSSALQQNYALGLAGTLFDPRVIKFNTEGLFRTNHLASDGTRQSAAEGRQGDVGYKVGVSLLPASAMPLFVQASRTISTSSGELGPSNPVRSGMIAPSGAPPVDFQALNQALSLGWQLDVGRLPRVELGYRQGSSIVTGGGYRATQDDEDVSANVTKDTARTRQALRFQRSSFESELAQTFSQRLNNLDYDFGADVFRHLHVTTHAGRRATFARSEFAAPVTSSSEGAYRPPPSAGGGAASYLLAGIRYEPGPRFSIHLDGAADRQTSEDAATSAKLATLSSHVDVVKGLRLTASGTSGVRGQLVGATPIDVVTRSATGGASYQATAKWLSGTVSAHRGAGVNETRTGRLGRIESWSREASLSTTFSWLGLGAGYERSSNRDGILDFGNYDSERLRASAQASSNRVTITTTADELRVERGLGDTHVRNLQRTFSATTSLRINYSSFVTASAGGFDNTYAGVATGRDQTLFWGAAVQVTAHSLAASVSVRNEKATARQTGFDQRALNGYARLEYRLRLLRLAAEYRQGESRLLYTGMPAPGSLRGRQVRVTIIRQFGFRR